MLGQRVGRLGGLNGTPRPILHCKWSERRWKTESDLAQRLRCKNIQADKKSYRSREAYGQDLQQLVEIVSKHFDPVPAITVQRYKFNVRIRQPGENVATFLSELRVLAAKCDFENSLDDMLRDRIVIGVNDLNI